MSFCLMFFSVQVYMVVLSGVLLKDIWCSLRCFVAEETVFLNLSSS